VRYKNIFLFGAGASHGCKGLNNEAPLGWQLYDKLKRQFPLSWGQLPKQLDEVFENDPNFENGMGKIWENNTVDMLPLKNQLLQEMGIYFSGFDIVDKPTNLYVQLIKQCVDKNCLDKTLFSTINYDCLLETAFQKIGFGFDNYEISEYERLKVIKLHGSCNFALPQVFVGKNAFLGSGAILGKGPAFKVKCLHPSQVSSCFNNNVTSLYPVMSIYAKYKPIQFVPDIINGLQKFWQEQIRQAESVFIIGISPNMDDRHIWDYISQTEAKIFYCGGKETFENWQVNVKRNDEYIANEFEKAIGRISELL
jgi:hypothetical protein